MKLISEIRSEVGEGGTRYLCVCFPEWEQHVQGPCGIQKPGIDSMLCGWEHGQGMADKNISHEMNSAS